MLARESVDRLKRVAPSKCQEGEGTTPEVGKREREREREREYYTFPALRLMQVLPGHALADSH